VRQLIVDGYNVLLRSPAYKSIAANDLDAARAALVSDIAAFAHGEYKALVVFDGGGNPASLGVAHDVAGVSVVFSPFGCDADAVIEAAARRAREAGDEAVVVTSDAQMQRTVMGGSVTRMSSDEFSRDVREGATDWAEHAPSGSKKGHLEDRIDPAIRARLARWAKGQD